jgi:hypothetical protein
MRLKRVAPERSNGIKRDTCHLAPLLATIGISRQLSATTSEVAKQALYLLRIDAIRLHHRQC